MKATMCRISPLDYPTCVATISRLKRISLFAALPYSAKGQAECYVAPIWRLQTGVTYTGQRCKRLGIIMDSWSDAQGGM